MILYKDCIASCTIEEVFPTVIIILCYIIIISVAVALAAMFSRSDSLLTNICAV